MLKRAQDFVAGSDTSGSAVSGVRFLGVGENFR